MKTPDKQSSQRKDKGRNTADRDTIRKHKGEQQQSAQQGGGQQGGGQQGGWAQDQEKKPDRDGQTTVGRTPPPERDRDYDPDGERIGGAIERP